MGSSALLNAAHRLYAAALEPGAWTAALDAVTGLVGGGHSILVAGDQSVPVFVVTAGLAEEHRERFFSADAMPLFEPFRSALRSGTTVFRQQLIGDDAFAQSALYNEIVRPAEGFHSLHLLAPSVGGFSLSICRGHRRGMFGPDEAATLEALQPHFALALEFRRRLGASAHPSAGLTRLVDGMPSGVILSDILSRVVHANGRATALIAEGDGLRVAGDVLAGTSLATTRELRETIAATAISDIPTTRRLRLPRAGRPPLLLSLMPIQGFAPAWAGPRTAAVAVFLTEPDAETEIDRTALAETYHLTRRECEVVVHLAGGMSPEAIAEALGLTIGAVRQYLKRAFDKTGRRSQAALVVLARGFTTPYQ